MEKDILLEITAKEHLFTKNQKTVAAFLLSQPNESAMLTIQDLARKTRVSESTIVRFAKTIGLTGYQDLRTALKERLMRTISASHRIQATMAELDESGQKLRAFVENQADYISSVAAAISHRSFAAACKSISTAPTVYLFGDGASATPRNALGFWLNRFGIHITVVDHTGRRLFDQIFQASKEDALVAFSFVKESREVGLIIDWMQSQNATSVLVTDVPGSLTATAATHVLFVERGPMESFHSMATPLVLAEALALSVARERGDQSLQAATLLDEIRRKYGLEK